jgi:hypothetical protein
MFQGKDIFSAPKDEVFTVLKHDPVKHVVYVEFYKDDGTLVAVTAPADAFEPSAPDSWTDLRVGLEAFRDQRYDDARRLVVAQFCVQRIKDQEGDDGSDDDDQ